MTTRTQTWPNGTPNWVDLSVKDLEGALAFYAALFGWEFIDAGEEAGHYRLATKDGVQVAGIGPAQDDSWPTVWTTYIAHDDVDAVGVAVERAGGTLLTPAMDVMDLGRMLIATGTDGAGFGVWQAKSHIGVGRVNEDGAVTWNELHTRDIDAAKTFLADVFGYTYDDMSSEGFTYVTFDAGNGAVGGIQLDTQIPDGVPNYWLTWFASDDVDRAVRVAEEHGGTIMLAPMDSAMGRMAVLTGPQGEAFGVIAVAPDVAAEAADG